jgi:hypothetical protein
LNLPNGTETSLIASLHTASKVLSDSSPQNDVAVVSALQAFINKIEAQRGKKISEADADTLVSMAKKVIAELGRYYLNGRYPTVIYHRLISF